MIDGCPAGVALDEALIQEAVDRRRPGQTPWTSPRKEPDRVQILSGLFEGRTTGAPISIVVWNEDARSSAYTGLQDVYRPGHANFTYLQKYGVFDWRGGGRASARETVCRVMAGAVAGKLLSDKGVRVYAHLQKIGSALAEIDLSDESRLQKPSPIFCVDANAETAMIAEVETALAAGDSIGAVVECVAYGAPCGLGEPIYRKVEAQLASAMLSIPASKGFEIGCGFDAASMRGSEHNDSFVQEDGRVRPSTNHAGGTLGGISTGEPLVCRVAFKPTSSIALSQDTVSLDGAARQLTLPPGSRHDPCVGIRAVPVVQAMMQIVLADLLV